MTENIEVMNLPSKGLNKMKLIVDEPKYKIYLDKDKKEIVVKIDDKELRLTQDESFEFYSDVWKAIAES
jgi:hypothetical protein